METLKPNPEDCKGCKYFIKKGSLIADRFPVKEDACVLLNVGKTCECLIKMSLPEKNNQNNAQ